MPATTRGSGRTFYNIATTSSASIPKTFAEEIPMYQDFLNKTKQASTDLVKFGKSSYELKSQTGFIFSEKAAWFGRILRFASQAEMFCYKKNASFGDLACCTSSAIKYMKFYMENFDKPIVTFVATRLKRDKSVGHCVALILYKEKNVWKAIIKDSLPETYSKVPSACKLLLKNVNIRKVKVISELPSEEEITETNCIRETFRVIGDVLDGKYPDYFNNIKFKLYDIVLNRELKTSM